VAIPCNQFGYQEPAANWTELYASLKYVRPGTQRDYHFVPKFPLTEKIDVNGDNAHPMMVHLREACPPPMQIFFEPSHKWLMGYETKNANDVRWNFEKWLIKKDGMPFRRYAHWTSPEEIQADIEHLLNGTPAITKGNSRASSKVCY